MSEMAKLLRLLVQGDKEAAITPVTVTGTATKFTSGISTFRKRLEVQDLSHSGSGEVFYGFESTLTKATGIAIPSGEIHHIPVSTDLDVYFICTSGELCDLRVREIG